MGAAVAVVSVASGNSYRVVTRTGSVYPFGNAVDYGAPGHQCTPITSAVATSDGGGYRVVTALGKVSNFGDAPNDGDMSGTHLNGPIIAASGS